MAKAPVSTHKSRLNFGQIRAAIPLKPVIRKNIMNTGGNHNMLRNEKMRKKMRKKNLQKKQELNWNVKIKIR